MEKITHSFPEVDTPHGLHLEIPISEDIKKVLEDFHKQLIEKKDKEGMRVNVITIKKTADPKVPPVNRVKFIDITDISEIKKQKLRIIQNQPDLIIFNIDPKSLPDEIKEKFKERNLLICISEDLVEEAKKIPKEKKAMLDITPFSSDIEQAGGRKALIKKLKENIGNSDIEYLLTIKLLREIQRGIEKHNSFLKESGCMNKEVKPGILLPSQIPSIISSIIIPRQSIVLIKTSDSCSADVDKILYGLIDACSASLPPGFSMPTAEDYANAGALFAKKN